MRRRSIRAIAPLGVLSVIAVAGCGNAGTFANRPRPATPVNLTVYVNDQRVSVSPGSVGAGPVQFIVTNEASRNESVSVRSSGGHSLASTGPINPGATAQVTVDFHTGKYQLATAAANVSIKHPEIQPATLRIGPARPAAKNALLQP